MAIYTYIGTYPADYASLGLEANYQDEDEVVLDDILNIPDGSTFIFTDSESGVLHVSDLENVLTDLITVSHTVEVRGNISAFASHGHGNIISTFGAATQVYDFYDNTSLTLYDENSTRTVTDGFPYTKLNFHNSSELISGYDGSPFCHQDYGPFVDGESPIVLFDDSHMTVTDVLSFTEQNQYIEFRNQSYIQCTSNSADLDCFESLNTAIGSCGFKMYDQSYIQSQTLNNFLNLDAISDPVFSNRTPSVQVKFYSDNAGAPSIVIPEADQAGPLHTLNDDNPFDIGSLITTPSGGGFYQLDDETSTTFMFTINGFAADVHSDVIALGPWTEVVEVVTPLPEPTPVDESNGIKQFVYRKDDALPVRRLEETFPHPKGSEMPSGALMTTNEFSDDPSKLIDPESHHIIFMPSGFYVAYGVAADTLSSALYVSDPENLISWPSSSIRHLNGSIIFAVEFRGDLVVFTSSSVYMLNGSSPSLRGTLLTNIAPAIDTNTILLVKNSLFFISREGVMQVSEEGLTNIFASNFLDRQLVENLAMPDGYVLMTMGNDDRSRITKPGLIHATPAGTQSISMSYQEDVCLIESDSGDPEVLTSSYTFLIDSPPESISEFDPTMATAGSVCKFTTSPVPVPKPSSIRYVRVIGAKLGEEITVRLFTEDDKELTKTVQVGDIVPFDYGRVSPGHYLQLELSSFDTTITGVLFGSSQEELRSV